MTEKIIVVSGYARAGKTTVMNYFAAAGYKTISSSECIHAVTQDFAAVIGLEVDTHDKEGTAPTPVPMNVRALLIGIAEEVLVKNFGRQIFASWMARQVEGHRLVAVECFNSEEYNLFRCFTPYPITNVLRITSPFEKAGIDGRDIIYGSEVVNNSSTVEDLHQLLASKY
jgi:hypothetical protein